MARIFPQDHSFFTLFTFSLPFLFCLLIPWANSSTSLPRPSSAVAAAEALSSRGYSLFASTLLSPTFNNASGTILAPPDFAFSFAAAIFNNHRHPPPRLTTSLLRYHTLNLPLTWQNLSSRASGHGGIAEIGTLHGEYCLFLSRKSNGDVSVAGSKKPILAVTVRQPDLYVDDHLTVHGIDGVLDPTSASKCSLPNTAVEIKSQVDRSFLDHAIRALNRRGFTIVATAMAIKRLDLLGLTAVTVFAPSDETLLSFSDGFSYDFLHHVVPKRLRLMELSRVPAGTLLETMAPNKMVVIGEIDGSLTANGVKINLAEVYYNPWIVVVSVSRSLDDATADVTGELLDSGEDRVPAPAPNLLGDSDINSLSPTRFSGSAFTGVPSPSPDHSTGINQFSGELSDSGEDRVPVSAPNFEVNSQPPTGFPVSRFNRVPSAAPHYSNGIREFSGQTSDLVNTGTPSPSPTSNGDSNVRNEFNHFRVPSPAPIFSGQAVNSLENLSPATKQEFVADDFDGKWSQSPSPIFSGEAKSVVGSSAPASEQVHVPSNPPQSPSPSPPGSTLTDRRCSPATFNGLDSAVLLGIEGGDLFCPVTIRKLEELNTDDVDQSLPSDALSQLSEGEEDQSLPLITLGDSSKDDEEDDRGSGRRDQTFMADDIFFYN